MKLMPATRAMHERRAGRLRMLAALLIVAASLMLVACGDQPPSAPAGSPSIIGIVDSVTAAGNGAAAAFLIDEGSGDYDKASIAVTAATAWYRTRDGKIESIEALDADTLVGRRVEVQFAGAVAESYPVQATAGWIIVDE